MTAGVFITDGHWRKSLAAVRALGRHRIPVTVGESTWLATAAFSRYCSRRIVYPSPLSETEHFVDFLHDYLRRHPHRMLLTMEDATIGLVARHRRTLSVLTYLPVISSHRLRAVQRKDKVLALANDLGIPTPRTWVLEHPDRVQSVQDQITFPVVIKPRIGSGAMGVTYVDKPDQLPHRYAQIHGRFQNPIIQEQIPRQGPGLGASFLMDEQSQVKAVFMHQRLREYPVSGGASTLRRSIWRDDIYEMGSRLLKAMNWFGVANVEFKLDPRDNTPKLMEVNPRFWGSLALAIHAGVNFPQLLYRMATGRSFSPVTRYRLDIQCRWMLPGDILHYIHNPRRHRLVPKFFKFRQPGLYYDILSRSDPLPVLGRLLMPLTLLYDKDMKYRLRNRQGS